MTEYQQSVLRCALADLTGAWQDWKMKGCPDSYHDWDAHLRTIDELAQTFDMVDGKVVSRKEKEDENI